jgi:thioesterase domain-containing protein/acyl carrier protein
LPDGNVEFLGRRDGQVKIHGGRLELGEVEAAISRHAAVAHAAVVARQSSADYKYLVAYVVPRGRQADNVESTTEFVKDLRQFLKSLLPGYMIPQSFEILDALPQLSSGKVNRAALPAVAPAAKSVQRYVAPRSPLEQQLAAIWSEVLQLDRVGLHDNFFDLGGHSLLAVRMTSRIRGEFSVDLPLVTLFNAPTLSELAEQIEVLQAAGCLPALPPIPAVARDAPLPMSYNQEPFWLTSHSQEGPAPYDFHSSSRLKGPLNVPALEQALNEMLRRHESLRTTFAVINNQVVQVVSPYEFRPLRVIDLSELPPDAQSAEVRRHIDAESQRLIDLAHGPLMRVQLLKLAADEHLILDRVHHIIYDGWSVAIFWRELMTAYAGFAAGLPSPLPEPAIQYGDFAVWQRERLQGEVLHELRSYWHKQLAGLPQLDLPADRPRPAVPTTLSGACVRRLPSRLNAAVERLSKDERVTTFVILLTTFQTLIQRYSGQNDFAISTPTAGRLRPELESVIGCFINDLVLRANLTGDPSFRELLGRARDTVLQAFEHQEMPLILLMRELNPSGDPNRPLAQVELILQNTPPEPAALPELELTQWTDEREIEGADLDLSLEVEEGNDGMLLRLCYHSDLFDETTAAGILDNFQVVLDAATSNPDLRLSQFLLATAPPSANAGRRCVATTEPARTEMDAAESPPLNTGSWQSLVRIKPGAESAAAPLFCIHGLGGHVAGFAPLASGLQDERPFYGLQAQGLVDGQQPHDRIETMAAFYVQEMREVQPAGPYLLAGWSMGGLIALEAAQQLIDVGEQVALVAMFDTHLSLPLQEILDPEEHSAMRWIAERLQLSAGDLRMLPLDRQWERISHRANLIEGDEVADIRRLAAVCLAHLAAAICYRPKSFAGRVVLFRAEDGRAGLDPQWGSLCPRLSLEGVPGNHYTMLRKPHVDVLADRLGRYLAEAIVTTELVRKR